MRRTVEGSVVVVVGATSGLGCATARAFARAGARLVLVGHDQGRVDAIVDECRSDGLGVVGLAVDVADASAADSIVATAIIEFGRIDTWVNCAAVMIAGSIQETPIAELTRLIDTNVRGVLLASRAALAQFTAQGDGVLINVASLLAMIPNPQVPAYVMSKYAIHGLSLSLHDRRPRTSIRVCSIMPGPLDTPMFERAGNHTGHELRAIPPACSPIRGAASILKCARRPRRTVTIGWAGRLITVAHRLAPATVETIVGNTSGTLLLRRRPAAPGAGGLFEWPGAPRVSGGWRLGRARRRLGDAIGDARIALHARRGRE